MAEARWTRHEAALAGLTLTYRRAGAGPAVLVLHHDIGTLAELPFYDALATQADVLVVEMPGFGPSRRAEWMRSVRDMAALMAGMLTMLGLADVALIGLGFGGWVAAEMASLAPGTYRRLCLLAPMGIKPPEGDILDQAIVSYIDYAKAGFATAEAFAGVYGDISTDQLEAWDLCREMSFRIAWKPYMYSQTLPHLLGAVQAPALIAWSAQDAIVPASAAPLWAAALPDARLVWLQGCGHCAEMEKPAELARLFLDFIAV